MLESLCCGFCLQRTWSSSQSAWSSQPVRTLKQTLMKLKTHVPEERKRGVVYEVPCKECSKTYIGETKRTLKVRLGEHKQAVKRGNPKNGIAVHAHKTQHGIDWNGMDYWKRRIIEAIQIKTSSETMNLDSGLQLSSVWNPILNPPYTIYILLTQCTFHQLIS